MLEPDVTITDFALAIECAVFAVLLVRRGAPGNTTNRLFALTFAALCASSLFGGIWHGVFSGTETQVGRWVWFATMTALACAALMLWRVGASWIGHDPWAGRIREVAFVQFVAQVVTSAFITDAFAIGAVGMMPPIALVTVLYTNRYRTTRSQRALSGVAGLSLAVFSGLVIAFDVSLHPVWATTHAVYHALQFVAFLLVFLSVPAAGPRHARAE